jgi:type VI secretion system secreted protein Hcp
MAALCTNDEIKEARLSMRKSGGGQEEYFVITLARARIVKVSHEGRTDGSTAETVEFTFNKVDVEYRPQKSSGSRGGATSFSDEFSEDV